MHLWRQASLPPVGGGSLAMEVRHSKEVRQKYVSVSRIFNLLKTAFQKLHHSNVGINFNVLCCLTTDSSINFNFQIGLNHRNWETLGV